MTPFLLPRCRRKYQTMFGRRGMISRASSPAGRNRSLRRKAEGFLIPMPKVPSWRQSGPATSIRADGSAGHPVGPMVPSSLFTKTARSSSGIHPKFMKKMILRKFLHSPYCICLTFGVHMVFGPLFLHFHGEKLYLRLYIKVYCEKNSGNSPVFGFCYGV